MMMNHDIEEDMKPKSSMMPKLHRETNQKTVWSLSTIKLYILLIFIDESAIEARRQKLKKKALERQKFEAEELLEIEDEPAKKDEEESSEYETEYESEEDEGPRLKPVFVRQKGSTLLLILLFLSQYLDRLTVKNLEVEEAKEKRKEIERKKLAEERKKYTLQMIEKDAKKDFEMERDENALLEACDSDDGDPDVEFEGTYIS